MEQFCVKIKQRRAWPYPAVRSCGDAQILAQKRPSFPVSDWRASAAKPHLSDIQTSHVVRFNCGLPRKSRNTIDFEFIKRALSPIAGYAATRLRPIRLAS